MKKVIVILCALALLLTSVFSVAAADSTGLAERNIEKVLTLKRGKTVDAWVFPFKTRPDIYLPDQGEEQVTLSYIKLSGAKGNVSITPASNGWLKATVVSNNKITLQVSGKNTSTSNKICTLKVKDSKGEFGTIKVTRGGIIKFTAIKQVGKKIQLTIKAATSNLASSYLRRTIFDKTGKVLSTEYLGTDGKKTVVDSDVKLKKGITVTYSVGYFHENINCSWSCFAAAIKIKKARANATGTVNTCINDDQLSFNDEWLYSIVN